MRAASHYSIRARQEAERWKISPQAAARIIATGYSPEGMEILAIFARLEAAKISTRARSVSA